MNDNASMIVSWGVISIDGEYPAGPAGQGLMVTHRAEVHAHDALARA